MTAVRSAEVEPPWLRRYPREVPPHLDYPEVSLDELVERSVERWPDRDALVFYGSRWSYRRFWSESERLAASLAREGVRAGDRVALCLPNCPAYPIAFFAVLRLGAVVAQVSPLWIGDDLEGVLRDAEAKAAITLELFYPNLERSPSGRKIPVVLVARLREFYPLLRRPFVNLVVRRRGLPTAFPRDPRVRPWRRAVRAPGTIARAKVDPATAVAVLQYTGGTTGTLKAAMLTHRNLVANVLQADSWNTTKRPGEEVVLASIPLFHVYGLTDALLLGLVEGGTIVLQLLPEPGEILRLIDRYRPTQFPAVPALYSAFVRRPDLGRYRIRSIRFCVSGSAPLPVEVQARFEELTGGHLVEGYGLTEASPVTHVNPIDGSRKPGSIGLPVPDTEQRIVDPDGDRELGPGEVGELVVRGPQVMLGYYRQPAETAGVLKDGWLRTGDLARIDADGFAYIVDRKKDLILVGGFNVYPREVEEALLLHPAVAEAAVVGVADPVLGEVPKAFVVRTPGASADEAELIAHVRERIAHYKAPRSVEFRANLPKTGVQKILRRKLRDEANGRTGAGSAAPPGPRAPT